MMKENNMKVEDIKLLEDNDWVVECESPFEISHKDGGSFASGLAARIVLNDCKAEVASETKMFQWQLIETPGQKKLNLPEFDKLVLLADKREKGTYAQVACLKSLDVNGPHWTTGNDVFGSIFGDFFETKRDVKNPEHFHPTYWTSIKIPD